METAYDPSASVVARMGRLRLRQFEVLIVIARHRTLTEAAQAINLTQPALSQLLRDIEVALGVRLFDRSHRHRLEATPFLPPVLRYAQRALADVQRLADDLRFASGGGVGRLRLGSMMVGVADLVPRAIAALRAEGSQIELEVYEDIAAGLWPRLEREELDLLIGRMDVRYIPGGVRVEPLIEDSHQVVVGQRHPLAGNPKADLRDASRFPWIVPPPSTALRTCIEENFISAGVPLPAIWHESGSITLNLSTVALSECVFVLASTVARLFASAGMIAVLPIQLDRDLGPVMMAWRDREPSFALARVQEALRSASSGAPILASVAA